MNLNDWATEIHDNACKHGWWEQDRSFGEIIALCHSELSEALEEYRDGRPMVYQVCMASDSSVPCQRSGCGDWRDGECELQTIGMKPEGIAVELIDCMIRILDYCGHVGIDVDEAIRLKHEYNKTRPYKHGGKVI